MVSCEDREHKESRLGKQRKQRDIKQENKRDNGV